ncbi:hypothetical protein [Streptomyces xiaopingdaonensis]|uniref:hypothetical protein n=1 Tax=Streptomyces xiaopingdaonensis TaxID=1565415 RepID=UPI0002FCC23D|nr:hypothetical protein [Streptomyces xiaopingdaonensis]
MALPEVQSANSPAPWTPSSAPLDTEEAESVLREYYPRLVRFAYVQSSPALGRQRRVLAAHSAVQRALPKGRLPADAAPLPAQRDAPDAGAAPDPAYAALRLRVLTTVLADERRRLGRLRRLLPAALPPLPRVWGLRLLTRPGGTDELALDQALGELSRQARAAYALSRLEGLSAGDVERTLRAAGVEEPARAQREAEGVPEPAGSRDRHLLLAPEFDACTLQARPTDLVRRRQHTRAGLAALAALAACGALLGLPGDGWGPEGAAAPPYSRNPASERALDPAALTVSAPDAWEESSRRDLSVWPARGERVRDEALLRRALAVWARPGSEVRVATVRGTSAAPPAGAPKLLYAGEVDGASVVLLYDGLRVARYAEPAGADGGPAALDLVRTDGADAASSAALVLGRSDSNVRYLTAPWISSAATVDLRSPTAEERPLGLDEGVTRTLTSPTAGAKSRDEGDCRRWTGLVLHEKDGAPVFLTDLGELTPVHLTSGPPPRPDGTPAATADAARSASPGSPGRRALAQSVCRLQGLVGGGVRSVNTWAFAYQQLPDGAGTGTWLCTRAETWRGRGTQAMVQFRPPRRPDEDGPGDAAVTARASDSPACGPRERQVVGGVLWKSPAGESYVLAAGSAGVTGIDARGGVRATVAGRTAELHAEPSSRVKLTARLADGDELRALGS